MNFKNESVTEKLFRDIPIFVEAAKHGSFTLAGEAMDIPLPTVSRRIAGMEKILGVPLFYRKTRKVELSEYGQALYERYRFVVDEVDASLEELFSDIKEPRGPVRFSVHPEVYHLYMAGVVSGFAAQWPGIQLTGQFSARGVDLYTEPFDLDIRAGQLPDSDLIVRKLVTLTPRLYASPKLLQHHPLPETPKDLAATIPCIAPMLADEVWPVSRGKITEKVTIRPVHRVDNLQLSLELALAGAGVAWSVAHVAAPYVERGELVPVLPEWTVPGFDISAVMASSRIPKRVRLFVDYLVQHFSRVQ
ncbi:LysR family transcriptional regulator [Desulfovibrio sp. OttesenSCG-928-M16]|nr:LysR family transcriptional regulator [Desulfovibrio sp. OttesenSCG-928-M16]